MANEQLLAKFPEYVTDGNHIYLWNEHYEQMLRDGRLKPSEPPEPRAAKKMNLREKTKLEGLRKKALQDAENAVKLLQAAGEGVNTETLFGAEPKD